MFGFNAFLRWSEGGSPVQKDFCLDKVRIGVTWAFKTELGIQNIWILHQRSSGLLEHQQETLKNKVERDEEGSKSQDIPIHKTGNGKR